MLPGYAERLLALRTAANLAPCVLSGLAGLHDHTVLEHEAERKSPDLGGILALAGALSVPAGVLAFGERAAGEPGPVRGLPEGAAATFTGRLRAARERLGLSLSALGTRSGVRQNVLSQWELGAVDWRGLSAERLLKVALALAVCPRWLAYGELPGRDQATTPSP